MTRFVAAGGLLAVAVSASSAGTIMFNAQGPLEVGSNDLVQFDVRIEVSQTDADAALPFPAIATLDATDISSDTFTVVPTPASAALMGLGGLLAARRRR